jgi:hypothetical protein
MQSMHHHLNKPEEAGLLKKTMAGHVVDWVILHDQVGVKKLLVPRDFFYVLLFFAR